MNNIERKIIKPKLGLLELAKQLGNVSAACKAMGYSRDTFYRFKEMYEKNGEEGLRELNRKEVPNKKNRVSENVEQACVEMAVEHPAYGQERAMNELKEEGGHHIFWWSKELKEYLPFIYKDIIVISGPYS